MPFENGEAMYSADSLQTPMDRVIQDCRDTLRSLRSIRHRKRSRSSAVHTVDDAAFDLGISRKYGKLKIVSPKLNEQGRRMLGPDWEVE